MTQYPPRHITTTLQVSDSTVRRWSEVFRRHLSPSAVVAPRRYTDKDVAVMTRIKALSDSGMRIEEINNLLDQTEPLSPTESSTTPSEAPTGALQPITALLDTLQAQQATQQQIASTLASLGTLAEAMRQIVDMRERLVRMEAQEAFWTDLYRRMVMVEEKQKHMSNRQERFNDQLVELAKLLDQMDELVQSIGLYMHDHSIKIGYRKPG